MREDLVALEAAALEASGCEAAASPAERIEFWNNMACHRFAQGDEAAAEALWRRVLDQPHLEVRQAVSVQQVAALNLGIVLKERGEFAAAQRLFAHVEGLAARCPGRPSVLRGARLYAAASALRLGDRVRVDVHLAALATEPFAPEDRYRRGEFLQVEGEHRLLTGDLDGAAARFEDALASFVGLPMDTNADAGLATSQLAVVQRRRGALAAAERLHREAEHLVAPWPRYDAQVQLDGAVTALVAGDAPLAGERLARAEARLAEVRADHLLAQAAFVRAVLAARASDPAAAAAALGPGVAAVEAGPSYYWAIAQRELAPELWAVLAESGHLPLLARIEASFPAAAARIRAELAARAAPPVLPPAPAARLVIGCLGPLAVAVAGEPVTTWPRKKARALLAHLVLSPRGLAREELAERLFPDLGFEEGAHQIDVLVSSLRKVLEPALGRREKSRYLEVRDRRVRLVADHVETDLAVFEAALTESQLALARGDRVGGLAAAERAATCFQGDLFDEPLLLEFFDVERHRLRTQACGVLARLAEAALAEGRLEPARAYLDRQVALEPADEAPHLALMRLYATLGQPALARRQFALLAEVLRREFDDTPSSQARDLLSYLTKS
jgi:DNA-binding SARP family transcriptional activator